ncbi:MAG: alpha-amylase family glycosyl hydrolase [Bacteroidota bacterium]
MIEQLPLVSDDPWLAPYNTDIRQRYQYFKDRLASIEISYTSLRSFASAFDYLGFNYDAASGGWWYREWAPEASELTLIGSFNQWGEGLAMKRKEGGVWEVFIDAKVPFGHQTDVKVRVKSHSGITRDRIPAWINYAIQDPTTYDFCGQIWAPETEFRWSDSEFDLSAISAPIIYEAHVGMSMEEERTATYREFADHILPRIKDLGFNTIQLMAVKEHPYYGSFGYHVSNFFASSSRFGTPDDLKYLINKAHELGIAVIMDAIYSHAVKNIAEGLNDFDGSGYQYFHEGGKGYHNAWDSKLFNYGKTEVLQFLLSSIHYWMKEFHFDGFRFDGVTSMMYEHHGDFVSFDHYDKYFKHLVDWDAIVFLQLANSLIHEIKPEAITIAEDMSGMPGTCRSVDEGGIGFDYRLGMGIPDYWIKILKHKSDEDWNIYEIWDVLSNRRYKEKTIAYTESHDQALVGDKTLAFWLMDKEMYWHMSIGDENLIIDRGIALLKMIRLITATLGGEGYLNFIGNEFGHPEWVDFPREGNGWSYKYTRRQWSLVDHPNLKYQFINNFERDMVHALNEYNVLSALPAQQLNMDEANKVIIFERNNLIFLFNFHTSYSIPDYSFYVPEEGRYHALLISDSKEYGGHDRIEKSTEYVAERIGGAVQMKVYLTNRTAMILKKID